MAARDGGRIKRRTSVAKPVAIQANQLEYMESEGCYAPILSIDVELSLVEDLEEHVLVIGPRCG